jgi:hypothetical protein
MTNLSIKGYYCDFDFKYHNFNFKIKIYKSDDIVSVLLSYFSDAKRIVFKSIKKI